MKKTANYFLWMFLTLSMLALPPGATGKTWPSVRLAAANTTTSQVVGASRTLLPDGRILIAGGQDSSGVVQRTLSTIDPVTGEITTFGTELLDARAAHTATVLPDGTVLVLGGMGNDGHLVTSAEIFDPIAETVRPLPTEAPTARVFHTATLLTDGHVLIAGGVLDTGLSARTVELWDSRTGKNTVL